MPEGHAEWISKLDRETLAWGMASLNAYLTELER